MRFEQSLLLNRYFHSLFGARDLTELKQPLAVQEGRAADGQSYFGLLKPKAPNWSRSR